MSEQKRTKSGEPDKRCEAHDKPYCGAKAPDGAKTASFRVKARDLFANRKEYRIFESFFNYKEKRFHIELTHRKPVTDWAVKNCRNYEKGNFYTELAHKSGKKYLKHKMKGNNAWFFHNDAALVQRIAKGIQQKQDLARICEEYKWNTSKAQKINEEAHERIGRWFRIMDIKNICASESIPEFPKDPAYELDFGTQSKYTILMDSWAEKKSEYVDFTLLVGDRKRKQNLECHYHIPERILTEVFTIIDIRKPCFYRDENGELRATIPYWYEPADLPLGDGNLGLDAGIIRIMKGGMVYKDGRYIENMALSEEVEQRNAHIRVLQKEKETLYNKYLMNKRLVEHYPTPDGPELQPLKEKIERLHQNYEGVRSNIATERASLCYLVARDVCVLIRQYGGSSIHLEDLRWVGGSGQSWNYSQLRQSVETVANRYGIKVIAVNAKDSSKTTPTKEKLPLKENADSISRIVVWEDGSEHDRDDTSGLELGCRAPGSVSHERDALVPCDVEGESREFAPEIPGVKVRGRGRADSAIVKRKAARPESIDMAYRPDLDGYHASIRQRRRELAEARKNGGDSFKWFDFVVGRSRSVAVLRKSRSVVNSPSGGTTGGVPACPIDVTNQSSTANFCLIARNSGNYR